MSDSKSFRAFSRKLLLISFGLMALAASICASVAADVPQRGNIDFNNVSVSQVLALYKDLRGVELVIDSKVKTVNHPINLQAGNISKEEVAKALEKALLEQAGIVITKVDDKKVSVTYNPALPIKKSDAGSSRKQ